MSVNFDFNFWTVLCFALNFGFAVFLAISQRSKAASDELKTMKTHLQEQIHQTQRSFNADIAGHGERLSRLESYVENAIGVDDMKAVHRRVDEILEKSSKIEGQMSMIIDILKRGNHG